MLGCYVHSYTYSCEGCQLMHAHMHMHTYTQKLQYTHACIHTHMQSHACMHTHVHHSLRTPTLYMTESYTHNYSDKNFSN